MTRSWLNWLRPSLLAGAFGVAVCLGAAGCTSSSDDPTTTSTSNAPVSTLASPSETVPVSSTTTVAPERSQLTPPEYQIVERIDGDGTGDTVIVLLDPASYDSLTDIDLYDLIAEVVELFPPIAEAHVIDDATAVDVLLNPDASEAERASIVDHYLARLEDGFKITYLGPFAGSGGAVLGS